MNRLLRYLKAAFWIREPLPLLGAVPINVLAVLLFAIVGFLHPAFWLIGIAGEAVFLTTLAFSGRFRKLVDALKIKPLSQRLTDLREQLLPTLTTAGRERHAQLQELYSTVKRSYEEFQKGDPVADDNLQSLQELAICHLRLLQGQKKLRDAPSADLAQLQEEAAVLQTQLASKPNSSESVKATLELTKQRMETAQLKDQHLNDVEGDLRRIEAQFHLVAESAALRAKPSEVSCEVAFVSQFITPTMTTPGELMLE
jgi:hypothetical protein